MLLRSLLKKRKAFGLRKRIVTSLTVIMVAGMLLIGVGVLVSIERQMFSQKVESGMIIARSIQNRLDGSELAWGDPASLHNAIVEEYRGLDGVLSVAVIDGRGVVLAHTEGDRIGVDLEEDRVLAAMKLGRPITRTVGKRHFLDLGDAVEVYAPLTRNGNALGCAQVIIPLMDLAGRVLPTRSYIIIYVVFLSFILVVFGSLLLSRIIVTPIKNLVHVMDRVSAGDLDQSIPVSEDNEIGQLTDAFNHMTQRLKTNQEALTHHVKALEQTNVELERSQAEVIQAVKLASIGRLAAGVAHEVGNPLSAIMGYIGILQKGGVIESEEMDILKRIGGETHRIDKIIRELLDYSRPAKEYVDEHDINEVVGRAISILSHQQIMEHIEIVLTLGEDLPHVLIDEHRIQQVIVNLVINALDAMPEGGTVTITTRQDIYRRSQEQGGIPSRRREDPPGSDFTRLRRLPLGSYSISRLAEGERVISITVDDTGEGIDADDLGKVLDPFFTTKDPGKGTGLGLAVAMRIIESFGGEIKIDSIKGEGTIVDILLPTVPA